ncbi:cadherin-5 isoform X2 [Rhinatrema bivittatum]|uniref:cadherin-5 isoform X2 n=1 Tax=Rhinatrema bivittatum TaxID=194408 RepID=UPI001128FC85|nr:cadherin-5 isoform X2 [Rhinatrema bivittatum]
MYLRPLMSKDIQLKQQMDSKQAWTALKKMQKRMIILALIVACHGFILATNDAEELKTIVESDNIHKRIKRDWVWNQMHITEEQSSNLPHIVGKITSNSITANAMYVLQGEYANTIFKVNDKTGDIFAFERLDREKKAEYELTALLIDRNTNKTLEPPSNFIIKVYDINDNTPVFVQKIFKGSVQEMSPVGTSVAKVLATDADDPTVAGFGQVTYQILEGGKYFTIHNDGIIYTAVYNLDREKKSTYTIIVMAKDTPKYEDGLTSTATVIITVTDINDNLPTFTKSQYDFDVAENARVGSEVGRLKVEDVDEPEQNNKTKYSFIKGEFRDTFSVVTSAATNEGILILKKSLDFESIKEYRFDIDVTDPTIDLRAVKQGGPRSIARVIINVLDVDEPPVFSKPSYYFEVKEDVPVNTPFGHVSAHDPDAAKRNVGYLIRRATDKSIITVSKTTGNIVNTKTLDRETSAWHNLTIAAYEIYQNTPLPDKESHVQVFIKVLDVNDNAPEFAELYEPKVCENAAEGTIISQVSAVDKDEMTPETRFTYNLDTERSNFTVQDNHDNTAKVIVKYGGFSREVSKVHFLPIVISDNGSPPQSSTNTLTIGVCTCDEKGEYTFCEVASKQSTVSIQVLVAILVCILAILIITLLIILRRRYKKDVNILRKNVAEIHEQLVSYDEEGGGEMDTTSYDVSVLNSVRRNITKSRPEMGPELCLYAQVQKPSRNGEMAVMIEVKKDEADNDGDGLPYDTLHIYGYEGSESIVESLSSLESGSSDSEIDYDVLNEWGPRFKMLADLYGLEQNAEDLLY